MGMERITIGSSGETLEAIRMECAQYTRGNGTGDSHTILSYVHTLASSVGVQETNIIHCTSAINSIVDHLGTSEQRFLHIETRSTEIFGEVQRALECRSTDFQVLTVNIQNTLEQQERRAEEINKNMLHHVEVVKQ